MHERTETLPSTFVENTAKWPATDLWGSQRRKDQMDDSQENCLGFGGVTGFLEWSRRPEDCGFGGLGAER